MGDIWSRVSKQLMISEQINNEELAGGLRAYG